MDTPEYDRRRVGEYLGLGAGFAGSTLLFTFLGWFLDGRIGTTPLFTLIGVLVGGAGGFYSLYRRAMALQDKEQPHKDDDKRGSSEP
jgi:F0F1-type ATP synthase assembly protein I